MSQLRQMSNDQLNSRLREIEMSVRRLRGWNYAGRTSENPKNNPAYLFKLRKEKARILTILAERKERKEKK